MRAALVLSATLLVLPIAGCGSTVTETNPTTTSGSTGATGSASGSGGAGGVSSSAVSGTGGAGGGATTTGTSTSSATSSSSSSSASSSSGSTGAGGGPSCPGLGDPCSDCVAMKCQDIYCGCYGNLQCGGLIQCGAGCAPNDAACEQGCLTQYKDGISAAVLLGDCGATLCPAECPKSQAQKPCQLCLYTKCSIQMNTCVANPECTAIFTCIGACDPANLSCPQGCFTAHPNGSQDAQGVLACDSASCSNKCP